jgi:predicted transcriptional regulator
MATRKRRAYTEIMRDILETCREGTLKTHIMHQANLSHSALEDYLEELQAKEFVQRTADEGTFVLTEEGNRLLEQLRETHQILEQAEPGQHGR